jgi:hypothetical protein
MRRKPQYSQAQWEAYARGENLAETRRPMRVPAGLTAFEQNAFREGYQTRSEDIRNRPVVAEIKRMVSPLPIKLLFQSLAQRS